MQRRHFLSYGLIVPGLLAVRNVLAQPAAGQRAAVVIGVDKAGDLPVLRAAKSGARKFAEWLSDEGFDVSLFVDDGKPVRAGDLFGAINALVGRGNLNQLVVYFAGHGFINSYSEHWMLSEAPDNPNEAVSLVESVALARQSAIPNVVFISDACRSRSDSLRTERVRGSLIFPNNRNPPAAPSDVDQFLATLVGDASWEVPVTESAGAYEGIYTGAFLDAFKRPDAAMVRTVDGKQVVPNNQLKSYLAREVPRRAQAVSIRLKQRPDTQVMSGETTYIGKAMDAPRLPGLGGMMGGVFGIGGHAEGSGAIATASIQDVATARLNQVGLATGTSNGGRLSEASINKAARRAGFDDARNSIAMARALPAQLSAKCGFAVTGRRLSAVITSPRIKADFANSAGDAQSALVEIDLRDTRAGSVMLQFEDGSGTVLAATDGFIGNVVVDNVGVSSVSYVPAKSNWMFEEYARNEARIADLHASVATAARFGVFRFDGPRETRNAAASQMADRIRILKGIDPTLGIYAAYAYYEAGLQEQVRSVMSFMKGDLGVDLFDVAMLAGSLTSQPPGSVNKLVPFLPMLSQGWALLRVKDVRLPEDILAAQDYLQPSLWTTLGDVGMRIVGNALRSGRLI